MFKLLRNKLYSYFIFFSRYFSYKRERGCFPVRRIIRPGRNEPCRCGSSRKYKLCHWQKDELDVRDYGKVY